MTLRSKKYNYNIAASGDLSTNNLNLGVSTIYSGSFSASNNVSIPQNVIGLAFSNSTTRMFKCQLTVTITRSIGGNLYELFSLEGHQTDAGWDLYTETLNDVSGIGFEITNTGQVQYTSSNIDNFVNCVFSYYVTQISTTGVYANLLTGTQGTYLLNSLQLSNTVNSVLGTNPGALYVMGGGTIEKQLVIKTTENAVGLGTGGALSVFGGTSISKDLLIGGNVGVGTSVPSATLDVNGSINATSLYVGGGISGGAGSSSTFSYLTLTSTDDSINLSTGSFVTYGGVTIQSPTDASSVTNGGSFLTDGGASIGKRLFVGGGVVSVSNTNTIGSIITTGGNVGIGTMTPSAKLDVNGTIRSTNFTTTNVVGTNITSTNVVGTNITSTNVVGANITSTNLIGANITSTNFVGANVTSTNVVGTNISSGTVVATTYTGGSMSLSGNLSLAGTLTTVNITTTNISETNVSAGTITATNVNITTQTVGVSRVTTSLSALGNSNTVGNIFTTGGNVGIGTTTPISTLHVAGNIQATYAKFSTSNGVVADFIGSYGSFLSIEAYTSGNTAKLPIVLNAYGGNVGIGTISPAARLDVNGGIRSATFDNITNQGAYLQWNRSNGGGETWLINQRGGGNSDSIRLGTAATDGSTVTEWWRFQANNLYNMVGGNTFIDGNSASTFIYGYNTPKSAGEYSIFQVYTNSTDRILAFQVKSRGTASGGDSVQVTVPLMSTHNSNTIGSLFTTSGNVGIGTVSPTSKLNVVGNAMFGSVVRAEWNNTQIYTQSTGGVMSGITMERYGYNIGYIVNNSGSTMIGSEGGSIVLKSGNSDPNSGTTLMTLLNSGNVGIGTQSPSERLHVVGNVYAQAVPRVVSVDLSAQSNTTFYPIVFENPTNDSVGLHYINVDMPSQGGGEAYNAHSMEAVVRISGWTDQTSSYNVYHNFFDGNERSILGIWGGSRDFIGIVVYLRGGKTYKVTTRSQTVTRSLTAITTNGGSTSTFALKNAAGADISGSTAYAYELINLMSSNAGRYQSNSMCVTENMGVGTSTPVSRLHVHASSYPNIKLTTDDLYVNAIDIDSSNKTGGKNWRLASTHQNAGEGQGKFMIQNASDSTYPFTITSSGNIGIGIVNPGTALDVKTNSSSYGLQHSDGTIKLATYVGGSINGGWFGTTSNHPVAFYINNGSPRLTIATSGNVGIGSTSPSRQLQVAINNPNPGNVTYGNISIFNASGQARYHLYNGGNTAEWVFGQKTGSNHDWILSMNVAGTEYDFFKVLTTGATQVINIYPINGTNTGEIGASSHYWSNVYTYNVWAKTGAIYGFDYAEMFEWLDGNVNNEDRIGITVVFDNGKIRPATVQDPPQNIFGCVSATYGILGNSQWGEWQGKYLKDDFGRDILGEDGNPVLNPNYNPTQTYTDRMARPEWEAIGLLGKLRIKNTCPKNPNWIKIRDVSSEVEEWYIR